MWIGGVRVIIRNGDGKILMVRQSHEGRSIWMAPGGGIEAGETSAEAAVREVKEETGLDIKIGNLLWHVEDVTPERGQRFVNFF
ncbi:MAG: NUDIX hydrolase, partial [Anaerovorax sp.]